MNISDRIWWRYAQEDIQELLIESELLVRLSRNWKNKFHDFSFIVFPAAKAYEGFLKKVFLDMGFITQKQYLGKRFRVGKALNPSLDKKFRQKYSVYDKIVNFCGGTELADDMWDTWKNCRNLLFHWFPNEKNSINYREAIERFNKVVDTMDLVFRECKIKR